MKHFLDIGGLSKVELIGLLDLADKVKKNPAEYSKKLAGKSLLMMFEKPSLRTRVSFEVGMEQLGGHAIYYDLATSPMGKKESVADTAKTASRYVNAIMARLYSHAQLLELAETSSVPVINALTNFSHPCQVLADLQTAREKKGKLEGQKWAYVGDANNNVTHSLMQACTLLGITLSIGCPKSSQPDPKVKKGSAVITQSAEEAVKGADVVYTDSWMSYHIPESEKASRIKLFKPYQVNKALMAHAKDAVFMHCLPAQRGMEVTGDVIDGKQSVVFDQAENRLHAQKALLLMLLGGVR